MFLNILLAILYFINPLPPTPTPYQDTTCPGGFLGGAEQYTDKYLADCGHCFGWTPTPTPTLKPTLLETSIFHTPSVEGTPTPTPTKIWAITPTPPAVQSTASPLTTWRVRTWTSAWVNTNDVTSDPAYNSTGITTNRIDDAWKSFTWQNFTGTLYIYRWGGCAFTLSYKDAYNSTPVTIRSDLTNQTSANYSEKIIEVSGENLWISYSTLNTCGSGSGGDVKTSTGGNLMTPTPSVVLTPEPIHCYLQMPYQAYQMGGELTTNPDINYGDNNTSFFTSWDINGGETSSTARYPIDRAKVKAVNLYDVTFSGDLCVKGRKNSLGMFTPEFCVNGNWTDANFSIPFDDYYYIDEVQLRVDNLELGQYEEVWLDGIQVLACSDDVALCKKPVLKENSGDVNNLIRWSDPICTAVIEPFTVPLTGVSLPGLRTCDYFMSLPMFSQKTQNLFIPLLTAVFAAWNVRILLGMIRALSGYYNAEQDSRRVASQKRAVLSEEWRIRWQRAKDNYEKRNGS